MGYNSAYISVMAKKILRGVFKVAQFNGLIEIVKCRIYCG